MDVVSGLLSVVIWLIFIGVVGTLIGVGAYFLMNQRRYKQYECQVWEKNGFDQLELYTDDAGIFIDKKTRNKRFFLKKGKVGLNPDKIRYVKRGNKRIVYLYKTGLKNYHIVYIVLWNNSNGYMSHRGINWWNEVMW